MLSLQKGAHLEMMSHMFQILRFLPLFKTLHHHMSNNARCIFQTSMFRLENAVKLVLLDKQNHKNSNNLFPVLSNCHVNTCMWLPGCENSKKKCINHNKTYFATKQHILGLLTGVETLLLSATLDSWFSLCRFTFHESWVGSYRVPRSLMYL